jgi:hypothetical protein
VPGRQLRRGRDRPGARPLRNGFGLRPGGARDPRRLCLFAFGGLLAARRGLGRIGFPGNLISLVLPRRHLHSGRAGVIAQLLDEGARSGGSMLEVGRLYRRPEDGEPFFSIALSSIKIGPCRTTASLIARDDTSLNG